MSKKRDPLSSQCTATAKSTGVRCQHTVIGGGPCRNHGGNAPQIKRKREERVMLGQLALSARDEEWYGRSPAEALLAATNDADAVLQKLKEHATRAGSLDLQALGMLGDWVDRVGRMAKTVIEGKVQQVLLDQQAAAVRSEATYVIEVITRLLDALGVPQADRPALVAQALL